MSESQKKDIIGAAPSTTKDQLSWLSSLYLPLVLLMIAAFAWRPLGTDYDVWQHAAVGRWIVAHQALPRQTLFLWSAPPVPYVAHSWLAEVFFYYVLSVGDVVGPYLTLIFTVVLLSCIYGLLWRTWSANGRITVLTPFLFSLAIQSSWLRFAPRPELFTSLFFVLLLLYLMRPYRSGELQSALRPGYALWLPLLFVLWANVHGGVVVGVIVLLATALAELAQDRFGKSAQRLCLVAVLCTAAIFINPYGMGLLKALQPISSYTFSTLEEWQSPFWLPNPLPLQYVIDEFLLVLIALGSWALDPQRRWAQMLWILLLGGAFLTARRYQMLLALTCLVVIAGNARYIDTELLWKEWWRKRQQEGAVTPPIPAGMRGLVRGLVVICLLVWIATPKDVLPLRGAAKNLPVEMAGFIRQQGLVGKMFTDMGSSCYFEWALDENQRYYIDVSNAYPEDVMKQYRHIMRADREGRLVLAMADFVALPEMGDKWPPVAVYLAQDRAHWAPVFDKHGLIFVRRTPRFRNVWQRFELH